MADMNGHAVASDIAVEDSESEAIRGLKALVGEIQTSRIERVDDSGPPFEQKAHTLMLESIDRIAQQWIGQLNEVRENTMVLEEQLITEVTAVKDRLTRLHLLGTQVMREAQRGREVTLHIAAEVDKLMTDYSARD